MRPSSLRQETLSALLALATMVTCPVPSFSETPGLPPLSSGHLESDAGHPSETPGRGGLDPVVFSTFSGIAASPFTIASQNVLDIPGATLQGADDFTVTGNGWTITHVEVRGTYFEFLPSGPTGPAESVNVYLLGDAGGLPDTTNLQAGSIYAAENLSYTDLAFGDFQIPLPLGGVTLLPGTYWLIIQPNMGLIAGGQWGWTESSSAPNSGTPLGAESAWMQSIELVSPANGGPYTCVGSWGARVTTCDITIPADPNPPPEPDLAFELRGLAHVAGVDVTPTALVTSEAGATQEFSVVLTAPPVGGNSVDVPLGAPNLGEGSLSTNMLSFDASNWDMPQSVTITPVDDALADGSVAYVLANGPVVSGDAAYSGLAVPSVSITNLDDETAGVSVLPTGPIVVSEDGSVAASFELQLNTSPAVGETVTIPLSVDPAGLAMLSSTSVPLTDTTPTLVTITGLDDDLDAGDTAFVILTGDPVSTQPGSPYDLLGSSDVTDLPGTRTDDDTAGFLITPGSIPLDTDEGGSTASFTVRLTSEPTANVTVPLFSSDTSEATASATTLTFQPSDWDSPQMVTITGEDDEIDDGDVAYVISLQPAGSLDLSYQNLDPEDVPGLNQDDLDTAGFLVGPPIPPFTTEQGDSTSFSVSLTTEPLFFVTLTLTSDDPTEGLLSLDGLTFQPSVDVAFDPTNWNVPQSVSVQGQPDALADGTVPYNIVASFLFTGDVPYDDLDLDAAFPPIPLENLGAAIEVPTLRAGVQWILIVVLALSGLLALHRRGPGSGG